MLLRIILLFLTFPCLSFSEENPTVLVSIAPYKTLVEQLLGGEGTAMVFVPPGASAHTFEPTPRHLTQASQSDVWFLIGEPFEQKASPVLQKSHPELLLVDLRKEIDLIPSEEGQCCGHKRGAPDPHFWLSSRRVAQQIPLMASTLSSLYPKRAGQIQERATRLRDDLQKLDKEMAAILAHSPHRVFFVSHPAYGYIAHDYDLEQVSIEFEGKDPTAQQITQLLQRGKREGITTIYIQPQHSTKGAELVAKQLGAKIVVLDPYADDYFANMRFIAQQLAQPAD